MEFQSQSGALFQPQLQPLLVAAAIICESSQGLIGNESFSEYASSTPQILIAQRKLDAKAEAGKWEFPGGKIEVGEHPEECLVREIREELGIEIEVDRFFAVNSHIEEQNGRVRHIVLLSYLCWHVGGEIQLIDAADAKWVRIEELSEYDFAVADLPFVERLQSTKIFAT